MIGLSLAKLYSLGIKRNRTCVETLLSDKHDNKGEKEKKESSPVVRR